MKNQEKKKKNRIYCAEGDPDYGCVYIAAPTLKEAKKYALGTDVGQTIYNYIDLRVWWCRGAEPVDYEGELDIGQINDAGLAWWDCPNCGEEEFEILDGGHYVCKSCNQEFEIPYI